jgi:hypothetical protein
MLVFIVALVIGFVLGVIFKDKLLNIWNKFITIFKKIETDIIKDVKGE